MGPMVVVTGGTGGLGREVVPRLRAAGCEVRVLSRQARPAGEGVEWVVGDLDTGAGIAAAVAGADVIVHCAGAASGDGDKTRQLVEAVRLGEGGQPGGGQPHLVFISVVGADRIPVVSRTDRAMFGYFASKRDAEKVVSGSGLPWTTLRATQFHDLTFTTAAAMTKLPVVPMPKGFRFQPVETAEVAERLVELALGEPAGLVPDLAGPRAYPMGDLVRSYLHAVGKRRPIVGVRMPGGAARAIRDGANLALDQALGVRTWEDYLTARTR